MSAEEKINTYKSDVEEHFIIWSSDKGEYIVDNLDSLEGAKQYLINHIQDYENEETFIIYKCMEVATVEINLTPRVDFSIRKFI